MNVPYSKIEGGLKMSKSGMNRRQFLEASSVAVAGTAAAVGTGTMLVAPDGAWAMTLQVFDEHTATTLVHMSREIYPHDRSAMSNTPRWSRASTAKRPRTRRWARC
jgi:hypothetical protein